MMRISCFLAVGLVVLTVVNSSAQEAPAITTVRTATTYRTAAENQFQLFEAGLATHCSSITADWTSATHRVYGQPQTAPDGKLVIATWVETVPGTACGQSRRYRVLITIRNGKAGMGSLLPGDGYAGPQLQHDARLPLAGAIAIVQSNHQQCVVDVTDTHLVGAEPAPKQPWNEIWTVSSCGKQLSVPMQFVPDAVGPGTSIHIEAKAINPLP